MFTIVFTINKRVECLKATLESWSNVVGIEQCKLRFFIEPTNVWGRQTETITAMGHPDAKWIVNERILGVLENPYRALATAFDGGAEVVLLAEEDVLVSRDVLTYFHAAFKYADEDTLAVCASTRGAQPDPEREYEIGWDTAFDPLVWGLRAQQWPLVRDTWDHDYSSGENGSGAGWDWNLNLRVIPQNDKKIILPAQSRSSHIGVAGAHCTPRDFPATQAPSFALDREPGQYWFRR